MDPSWQVAVIANLQHHWGNDSVRDCSEQMQQDGNRSAFFSACYRDKPRLQHLTSEESFLNLKYSR
jgi:hypothetical protein